MISTGFSQNFWLTSRSSYVRETKAQLDILYSNAGTKAEVAQELGLRLGARR